MNPPLLEVEDAKVHFTKQGLCIRAVDGVSLTVGEGEVLGLVGESGCGKTTLARAVMRLTPLTAGRIRFAGTDLHPPDGMPRRVANRVCPQLQMIFQDPFSSLNPRMTVFDTLAEPLLVHRRAVRREVAGRVAKLMEQVGLAARFTRKYPHEFSGGQRQRIAIARALALEPRLIIADEPVSALDVSVQAQILNLLAELIRRHGLALILVSHDLAVVRHLAHRVAVMCEGRIVEMAETKELFENPENAYTRLLLDATPSLDPAKAQANVLKEPSPGGYTSRIIS